MTSPRIELPDDAISALAEGKSVRIETSRIGPPGANGTLVIAPDIGKFATEDGEYNPRLVRVEDTFNEERPDRYMDTRNS